MFMKIIINLRIRMPIKIKNRVNRSWHRLDHRLCWKSQQLRANITIKTKSQISIKSDRLRRSLVAILPQAKEWTQTFLTVNPQEDNLIRITISSPHLEHHRYPGAPCSSEVVLNNKIKGNKFKLEAIGRPWVRAEAK